MTGLSTGSSVLHQTLEMALEGRSPVTGLVHHSDLGYLSPAEFERTTVSSDAAALQIWLNSKSELQTRSYLTNQDSMLSQNCHEKNCLKRGFTAQVWECRCGKK